MLSHHPSFIFAILLIVVSFCHNALAQVGPTVTSPEFNATVNPGEKITIAYEYQNVGTGNYTLEINLWKEMGRLNLLRNVVKDEPIPGGNSTGTQINFTLSATYDWKVPKDLTVKVQNDEGEEVDEAIDMFYLDVSTTAQTHFFQNLQLKSRPVRLHYNAGALTLPNSLLILALSAFSLFYFSA